MKSINSDIKDNASYYFPFEGDKHLATIMILPFRKDVWYKNTLPALKVYKEIITNISKYETVILIIHPLIDEKIVKDFETDNVIIYRLEYDDCWARDISPIFLKKSDNEELIGVDFSFNGYGGDFNGLYYPYNHDLEIAKNILLELLIPRLNKRNMILEGGSVLSNGKGSILTTSECLLSIGRNPNMSKEEIEKELLLAFNAKKVIFLPYGVIDDETTGHVDNIASFLDSKTIALAYEEDENDVQHLRSVENYNFLLNQKDQDGNPFDIIKIPFPKKMYMQEEDTIDLQINKNSKNRLLNSPLAPSYLNFYQSDKFVIIPQFNDENDKIACKILEDFYKDTKEIIPIYSRDILLGGGNIHCITMQIPYSDCYNFLMEAKLNG